MGNCWSKSSPSPVITSPPNPSSPTRLESCPPCAGDSGRPSSPPVDAIESLRGMYDNIDLHGQIDLLIGFIENQIQNMKTPSEAGPSSSGGWLETVQDGTKLAAKTVDIISKEAEKLSESDAVKGLENLTLKVMKGVGDLHWVFLGLSIAAFAIESYLKIGSIQNECKDLLLKLLELAKDVKEYDEVMPGKPEKIEKVCNAVGTIVEGAIICVAYLQKKGYFYRFWSTSTTADQLDKTNKHLKDIRDSLVSSEIHQLVRQTTRPPEQNPLGLLDFQPVGIEKGVEKVKELLDMEGDQAALAVIICGFGGLGKSTLAASVVESLDWSCCPCLESI